MASSSTVSPCWRGHPNKPALYCCLPAILAGNGRSQKPSLLDKSTWWTVDDHFLQDVPAVLEYVLQATGANQVHWVGHSMVSQCTASWLAGWLGRRVAGCSWWALCSAASTAGITG